MSDEGNRDETSCKNENDSVRPGLPVSCAGEAVKSEEEIEREEYDDDHDDHDDYEKEEERNPSRSFSFKPEVCNDRRLVNDDDDSSHFYSRPTNNYYDFQQGARELPMVVVPTSMTMSQHTPVKMNISEAQRYYTVNDVNVNPWLSNLEHASPISFEASSSDCYVDGNQIGVGVDYFYPIFYGTGNAPTTAVQQLQDRYTIAPNAASLALGYNSGYPYVVPYTNYTSLQPQNFYTSMRQPYVCKPDCAPTTRFPTTVCTQRPGQKVPVIAWENNNTCCCELYGPPYGGVRVGPPGRGRLYGPCKPPPMPRSNQRDTLYCHGRRRKREYYLQAPKARVRVQRESDRCRITTTTTPRPHPWPTNYPIKFRLQKSLDVSGPSENQVNNLHDHDDKMVIYENQAVIDEKSQRSKGKINKNIPETASSKLRKKHNEVKMQELQESLEIALEKMNQEMLNE